MQKEVFSQGFRRASRRNLTSSMIALLLLPENRARNAWSEIGGLTLEYHFLISTSVRETSIVPSEFFRISPSVNRIEQDDPVVFGPWAEVPFARQEGTGGAKRRWQWASDPGVYTSVVHVGKRSKSVPTLQCILRPLGSHPPPQRAGDTADAGWHPLLPNPLAA